MRFLHPGPAVAGRPPRDLSRPHAAMSCLGRRGAFAGNAASILSPVLLLASTSPRRQALLAAAGIPFRLVRPGPEPEGSGAPREVALLRARAKALGAQRSGLTGPVLGVDTVVACGGVEYDKPASAAEARTMLRALSGRVHDVHTALCLVPAEGPPREHVADARVRCDELSAARLEQYLESEAWVGKAGSYGIQDPQCDFMHLVHGERDTVIGLPIEALRELLDGGKGA